MSFQLDLLEELSNVYRRLTPLSKFNGEEKWVKISQAVNLSIARVITPAHVGEGSTSYVKDFIISVGPCAMFPIQFSTTLFGFVFRALNEKAFSTFSLTPLYLYSSTTTLKHFSDRCSYGYGYPFLVSEGFMDAELLGGIWPVSLGMMTSHISDYQAQFISMFTNRVILVPDNDDAGDRGVEASERNLGQYGIHMQVVRIPKTYEDPGDLLHKLVVDSNPIHRNVYSVLKEEIHQRVNAGG